ncbi:MAG: hypothetical protein NC086_07545 [Alistipes sp.]|nr:hypothetical protein [Alistipes sp.]
MSQISELDLQNLRHLIGDCENSYCKMTSYANDATDPKVKQFFKDAATDATNNKKQLMEFLD